MLFCKDRFHTVCRLSLSVECCGLPRISLEILSNDFFRLSGLSYASSFCHETCLYNLNKEGPLCPHVWQMKLFSIPLSSVRLSLTTQANQYNPTQLNKIRCCFEGEQRNEK